MIQSHDFASTYVGTPFYMSPEICAAERYTLKSDIWSLGCVIYELCSREPPFNAKSHFQLVQKIKEGKVAALPRCYSAELMGVIRDCLKVNPDARPDTAALLNLPVVRLMRMQREALDLRTKLEAKDVALDMKLKEAEKSLASFQAERASVRQEIESSLRREWEVKARLEIDRLVKLELEELHRRFEGEVQAEVQARVQEELQKKSVTFGGAETVEFASSFSKSDYHQSIAGASTDGEFPSTTDITELSVGSPEEAPVKKGPRAPLGRAQTMFERHLGTPMDVDSSPSPMAIASLSLSPRRANSTKGSLPRQASIFHETDDEARWSKARESDPVLSESEDDDSPIIPSPTRPPRSIKNPFQSRPILTSVKTAPVSRSKAQGSVSSVDLNKPMPSLPGGASAPNLQLRPQASSGALRERGNSPNRRLSKIPSVVNLAAPSGENGLQRKQSVTKKDGDTALTRMAVKNNVKGRTLVELQQARNGGRPVENANSSPKRTLKERLADRFLEPAPVWDPERDEMPSPFLSRRRPVSQAS
jgi:NIMA (never in mitosis gene a)-related kinase